MQPGQEPALLPRLRQDLKLMEGPRHRDGSPTWRILDPVRNRFFEIGWLEFELLARWAAHEHPDTLVEEVAAETPLTPSEEEVVGFIDFLVANQLVQADSTRSVGTLRSRFMAAKKPWYERLFHHYLFFRVPLVRPDRFLERTLPLVQIFYTRAFAVLVLLVFVVDMYLLSRELDELRRTFAYFFNLEGGLYFAIAATFSKIIHEFGHAYTARRHGVRVPTMGVAFLVMWPFLYTDTGETWKLGDRRKQLAIASAGIVSELVLAIFATLLWAVTPEGTMKHIYFILATTTWVMTLAINASPFMRFDGYFLASDALDFPNLHERSFACARWWIRTRFFRLDQQLPEPTLTSRQRSGLVAFALGVWLYRFTVFLGIALLVYYMFYKPLGILLMAAEIWWFILKPVVQEIAYLWSQRRRIHLAGGPVLAVVVLLLALVWLVPVSREVTAPAVVFAQHEQAVYAPFAARIRKVEVTSGQSVKAGDVLVRLDSPDLELRLRNADLALATARSALVRGSATSKQQERSAVLLEQVAQALAEQQAVREEQARLELRATTSGIVRDLPGEISAGRWIGPREMMMRIVSPGMTAIEAYLTDSQIGAVHVGQEVKFFPDVAGTSVVRGRVKTIDATANKRVPRALLAAPYGGDIPAVIDKRDGIMAQNALYRVVIDPEQAVDNAAFIARGTVRIKTDLALVAETVVTRGLSILIRESGI